LDPTDGGSTSRYSGSLEWQRSHATSATKVTAYGVGYDLDLFSNFTFYLHDPIRGDQFEQVDRRYVLGAKIAHRRIDRWGGREMQNSFGIQVRNDDITALGLYRTQARQRVATTAADSVLETSAATFGQNEIAWAPWLRTIAGMRVDGYRFAVDGAVNT